MVIEKSYRIIFVLEIFDEDLKKEMLEDPYFHGLRFDAYTALTTDYNEIVKKYEDESHKE